MKNFKKISLFALLLSMFLFTLPVVTVNAFGFVEEDIEEDTGEGTEDNVDGEGEGEGKGEDKQKPAEEEEANDSSSSCTCPVVEESNDDAEEEEVELPVQKELTLSEKIAAGSKVAEKYREENNEIYFEKDKAAFLKVIFIDVDTLELLDSTHNKLAWRGWNDRKLKELRPLAHSYYTNELIHGYLISYKHIDEACRYYDEVTELESKLLAEHKADLLIWVEN